MAIFPDGNPGAHPLDPTSPVGRFRILYGDTDSEPYDPVVTGTQNYQELSDAEIEGFISQGGDSIPRGIGYLYIALAGQAAKQSKVVQDQDLRVDLTKRAADLRAIADVWFGSADNDDLVNAEEAFEIVPTGSREGFIPEGTRPIFGRQYTWSPAPITVPSSTQGDLDGGTP